MVKTRDRKGIVVVRIRQERTGVLYTEKKEMHHPEDFLYTFGRLFEHASVEMMLAVSVMSSGEPVADRYHGYSIKCGKELYNEEQEGA